MYPDLGIRGLAPCRHLAQGVGVHPEEDGVQDARGPQGEGEPLVEAQHLT